MLVVGVAGGSGSGKTTVAKNLFDALSEQSAVIEFDSYYRDMASALPSERAATNYDHPNALETELLVEHIESLGRGGSVAVPRYDFVAHRRTNDTRLVTTPRILIIEGILALAIEPIRNLFDIKIFVDTDPDIRVLRRVRRDIEQRGRTFSSVRKQYYEHVRPMHKQFVEPSKQYADILVPEGGENVTALEIIVARLREHLNR